MRFGRSKVKPIHGRAGGEGTGLLAKSDRDAASMRLETLRFGQRHRRRADLGERGGIGSNPGGAVEEVVDREARGKARRTAGRQNVIWAGNVVAHRLWTELAE